MEAARSDAGEVARRFSRLRGEGNAAFFDALALHFAHLSGHPMLPLHFEYAATANQRGAAAAERLSRHAPLPRAVGWTRRRPRVLDVGCAYGGFLVAMGRRGASVTGIELDPRLLALARINLQEQAIDADLVQGDATSRHPRFRGRFDLVIANDLVEHVASLERFLENLSEWLSPAGMAYLEIPNGAHPPFVASDGHHGLFGITLLDFEEASRYIRALNPNGRYDTYRYPDLASYRQAFAAAGLSLEVLPETLAHASGEGVENELAKLSAGAEAGLSTVPPELRDLVRERLEAYLSRARAASWREGSLLDYGPGFWIALSRRSR
jgi:2-polyprenyl-3-methyl-5-hydroxy-6-metoxy-1,4-benzoquinol methylase